MSDSKLNDEIFDALLKEALSQLEEEKVKEKNRELEQIDTSDYVPSKSSCGICAENISAIR